MRVMLRKALKKAALHGSIASYRRMESAIRDRLEDRHIQREVDKKLATLIATAKTIKRQDNPRLVVSLTSYGHRLEKTAPLAVASLLNQTVLPDKIVLWLAYEEKLPRRLKKLEKYGVNIEYTNDTKPYKKLIPTLKSNPESVIVTVDDDMLYPETWLEKTIKTHEEAPNSIIVNRGKKIIFRNGQVAPYVEWPLLSDDSMINSHLILPTGAGGVLYPPNSLDNRVGEEKLYMRLAPHADDLWFWAMAELKGTKRSLVRGGFNDTIEYELDNSNDSRLSIINVDPDNKINNDTQLAKILDHFPRLLDTIKSATE